MLEQQSEYDNDNFILTTKHIEISKYSNKQSTLTIKENRHISLRKNYLDESISLKRNIIKYIGNKPTIDLSKALALAKLSEEDLKRFNALNSEVIIN